MILERIHTNHLLHFLPPILETGLDCAFFWKPGTSSGTSTCKSYIYIYTVYTDNKPTPGKAFEDASVMLLSAVATQAALKQIACENNAGKPYGFGVAKTTVFVALNVDAWCSRHIRRWQPVCHSAISQEFKIERNNCIHSLIFTQV